MKSDRFIDGFHLQRNIVSYIPHLRQFDFHIRSILRDASYIEVNTIRQSFIEQQSVDCSPDYFNNQYGQSQIYSLPFIGNRLDFISNQFPPFDDVKSFENVFFERVTRALSRLQTLEISNQLEQEEKTTNKYYRVFSLIYTYFTYDSYRLWQTISLSSTSSTPSGTCHS